MLSFLLVRGRLILSTLSLVESMWGQTRHGEKPAVNVSCTVVHHCQVTFNLLQVEKFQAPKIFCDVIHVQEVKHLVCLGHL